MLIKCSVYEKGKKVADISQDQIRQYLEKPNYFIWVALVDPEENEFLTYQREFGLHHLPVEDVLHAQQAPKIEEYGDSMFVVVKTAETRETEIHIGEVHMFVSARYIISIRINSSHGFSHVRNRLEREPYLLQAGSGFVLYALVDAIVDQYFPVLGKLEEELEFLEEQLFSTHEDGKEMIKNLYHLKQKITTMKHLVGPMHESVGKLYGGRVPPLCLGIQEYFRDVYDHLFRINQSLDNIREMVLTAIQVNISLIGLVETEVNKKLAGWAAILAVPTLIAGIYGMNFSHMPELHWEWGYFVVLFVMLVSDAYLYYKFKKINWL